MAGLPPWPYSVVVLGEQDRRSRDDNLVDRQITGRRPTRVVRRLSMGIHRGVVMVDLVEEEVVFVFLVLEHVEADAARLVADRGSRIVLGCNEEPLTLVRLDLHRNHLADHGGRIS